MSASPGGNPKMAPWVTQAQVDEIRAMNDSMKKSASTQRPGRGRGSVPSFAASRGRGRGRVLTSAPARSAPPPTTSLNYYNSTAASRNTQTPGATRSIANALHAVQYNVGLSTTPTIDKSPQRTRPASPIRATSAPNAALAAKLKSPPKLRNSILVPGHAQPMMSPDFGQVQQMPSAQATASFGGNQAQAPVFQAGPLPGQAVPDPDRKPIVTTWTKDDPTKPIIDGHFRQVDATNAVNAIAVSCGMELSQISKDGCSIGGTGAHAGMPITTGLSRSIYAPGNAKASRAPTLYQADVSGNDRLLAEINREAVRVPPRDNNVEMSDRPIKARPVAPLGPVDWDNLPMLASSKFAPNSTYNNATPQVPKPVAAFKTSSESMKPVVQDQAQGFGEIAQNSSVNVVSSQLSINPFASNIAGASNQPTQTPTGFYAAAQLAAVNPILANGGLDSQNTTNFNAVAFGAPSSPPASGSAQHSNLHPHPGFGVGQSFAPALRAQTTSNTKVFGDTSAPGPAPWGLANLPAPMGQTGFGVARPAVARPGTSFWGSGDISANSGQRNQGGLSSSGFGAATSNSQPAAASFKDQAEIIRRFHDEIKRSVNQPSYQPSPFDPPPVRPVAADRGPRPGPTQSSLHQGSPEEKTAGLAGSQWA